MTSHVTPPNRHAAGYWAGSDVFDHNRIDLSAHAMQKFLGSVACCIILLFVIHLPTPSNFRRTNSIHKMFHHDSHVALKGRSATSALLYSPSFLHSFTALRLRAIPGTNARPARRCHRPTSAPQPSPSKWRRTCTPRAPGNRQCVSAGVGADTCTCAGVSAFPPASPLLRKRRRPKRESPKP